MPFLDVAVFREDDHFNTSIFRKPTFTGLGSNFYSNCPFNFKLNALSTLLHRAVMLTSNWVSFHREIDFLHNFFKMNYYPSGLFYKYVNRCLANIFNPVMKIPTVPKLPLYASIPHIRNGEFKSKLTKIINHHFNALDLRLIATNPLKIGSLFKIKDTLSYLMTSSVVYKYTCPRCNRGTYVGSTRRLLKVRIDAHRGVSHRTGSKLSNPEFSSIRDHSKTCKIPIEYKHFEIISRAPNDISLSILESLNIKQVVPSLNVQTSSAPLFLS